MPEHRQGCSTPREAGIWHPQGGYPSPPDALRNACDAKASRRITRLSGRTWEVVVWVPYVRFYPLAVVRRYKNLMPDCQVAAWYGIRGSQQIPDGE